MTTKADRMTDEEIVAHQRDHWNPDQYPDTRWGTAMKGVCEFMQDLEPHEYRSWLRSSQDYGETVLRSV